MNHSETEGQSGHVDNRLVRAIGFIERNLEGEMLLLDIAARAGLSEYHFHRLFRTSFGIPVIDYVRRRRLTEAARRLISTRDQILDVALGAGFESQAAFTRAFRRVYHLTPAVYRNQGRHVPWLSADVLNEATLSTLPELGLGSPRQEVLDSFPVVGLQALFSADQRSEIPALWRRLALSVGAAKFDAADRYGISDGSARLGGMLHYTAAIAAAGLSSPPTGLALQDIQSGYYLVFAFRGLLEGLSAAMDYIFGVWLPSSGYLLRPAPNFQRYAPGFNPNAANHELELWIPADICG